MNEQMCELGELFFQHGKLQNHNATLVFKSARIRQIAHKKYPAAMRLFNILRSRWVWQIVIVKPRPLVFDRKPQPALAGKIKRYVDHLRGIQFVAVNNGIVDRLR